MTPLRFRDLLCVSMLALLLPGCATQLNNQQVSREALDEERAAQMALAVDKYLDRQVRLDRVAKRVEVAGAELCGEETDYAYGITWASDDSLTDEYQQVADQVGLTGGVQIWGTAPGLPASVARIAKGTQVAAVNGKIVSDFPSLALALYPSWQSGRLRLQLVDTPGEPLRDITLRGLRACRYLVVLTEDDSVNAYADGDKVYIPQGMMRFADDDEELALVVGHEIAHNLLGHVKEQRITRGVGSTTGALIDLVVNVVGIPTFGGFSRLGAAASDVATRSRSRGFEADADYMGLYMVRRAGYDISKAQLFWREMAAEYPASIGSSMMATHPSSPERAAALRATVAEIRSKEERRGLLVPDGAEISPPANQDSAED